MIEKNRLAMLFFLASEAAFFGVLILSYLYYYPSYAAGPNAATVLDPLLTGIFTVALLASSGTLWLAQRSADHDNQPGLRLCLGATVALGLVFLAGQAWEYAQLIGENVTVSSSLFGTTFFTLTGFHGVHVLGGLVTLMILLGLAFAGHLRGPRTIALTTVELYWHFVDVVWILIFGIVYLWPRL